MIAAEGLGKRFGDTWALRDLSLRVPEGAFLAVLGRNGAGKTTLVRLLTGQLRATEGSVRVAGLDPAGAPLELRRMVGVMPEEGALLEDLGGAQYLQFVGRLHGLGREVLAERVAELEACLEVGFGPRPIRDYSYGMKKKLAFSAALLHGPRLVFLDEPFEGLDPSVVRSLLAALGQLRDRGVTVVMTSHQLSLAERLATRILLVEEGRLLVDGAAGDVLGPDEDLEGLFLRLVGRGRAGRLSWI
ncbi:ABC transporter ATP-binding protein [Geothrix sp. 21YS21S-2]|uniref:ABC transporter ATP-binding protein n=1 Tax=Geothrix sp. 21YS21S-2 TaxID=3068893 RepID=UPI0027B99B23|nr:ABC transporter ATP-binding protein [Geothrix sp. 21YS21S-2]